MPLNAASQIDDQMSDTALLVAVGNGDAAAARLLVASLTPRLFSHAARVLGDRTEAEDVVQETLLRL
ncbi:MAG: RNA polymerase subunit sigma, partial [Boseongicola sp.]